MNMSYFKAPVLAWKKVKRLLLLSFLVTTNNVFANDLTVDSVSLSEAIQRTLANNPQLTAFKYKQKRLDGELATAGLKPEYNVSAELENFAGTGDVSGFSDAELTLSISSVVELGDKVSFFHS